jgi:hypothetical protein
MGTHIHLGDGPACTAVFGSFPAIDCSIGIRPTRVGARVQGVVTTTLGAKNMTQRNPVLMIAIGAGMVLSASPVHARNSNQQCEPFSELSMVLEQNATDGDAEVVLFAKGQDEGLRSLTVISPTGRLTTSIVGSNRGVGLREFVLESAEPPEIERVLRSFPEGTYHFRGKTISGTCLRGTADLSHTLAPATVVLTPAENEVVALDGLVVTWAPVPGAVSYIVEVDNEDRGNALLAEVFAPGTSFNVPSGWLEHGTEYLAAVAVKMEDGNKTSVENAFTTIDE